MGQWPQPPIPRRWAASSVPPLVGRGPQFAVLEDVWRCVEGGTRQVVLIGGEAGAGKSRLASEAAVLLHRHGVTVLLGTCVADLGRAYDPFVEPLAALLSEVESGALTLPGTGQDTATQIRLLRLIARGAAGHGAPGALHQPALLTAATSALTAAAAVRPLVLVLEDLQWAGAGALTLLRFAVERTPDVPLLFLVTMRTEPPDLSPEATGLITDLMRLDGVHRLDLPGLADEEITEYLVRGAGLATVAARRLAGVLREQTAGNPFLLREVCRERAADLASGALPHEALRAPESFRASTRSRVERLPASHRRVLETAAVVGEEFDVPLVTASLHQADDPSAAAPTPDLVFAALESARALGLVEWLPAHSGVARFPHAIARQAVLDLMSEYDRARTNACVAVALEDQFPSADRSTQRLAHHYASAAALGFADKAADYLEAAGEAARARLSYADAASLFEKAAHHATAAGRRDDLRLASGRAHLRATYLDRARELAELVAADGAPEQRLRAAVLFEAASWQGNAHRPRSVELLTAALGGGSGAGPERDRIVATAALARAMSFSDRTAPSAALRADSIRRAREIGEPDLLAAVLAISLLDGLGSDGLADRLQRADELTALVGLLDDVEHLGPAAFHRCVSHYVLGDPAALDRALLDLARTAQATSEPYWALAMSLATFALQLLRCEFPDAAASLEQTTRLGSTFEGGYEAAEGPLSLQSYMLRRETGRLAPARRLITGNESPTGSWAPGLLALYTEFEMAEPAQRILHWLLSTGLDARQRSASWPAVLSFLVDAAVWLADREAARALLPLAGRFAGRNLVASELVVALGSGDRMIGALESVLGVPSAEEHFVAALEMDSRMGSPLHRATTLAEHVAHLRRAGDPRDRAGSLTAQARELCARHHLARVERLLGSDAAPTARQDRHAVLTPREVEVLGWLGRGLSNRDIAAALVISEYTAANHVRNILGKIQCANRTQAAMYAVDHGLTRPDPG